MRYDSERKSMKALYAILLLLPYTWSCTEADHMDMVQIRIDNVSDYDYEDVIVLPFTDSFNYGDIEAGDKTEYHPFSIAYRYAYVRLIIAGDTSVVQPIDFVGETPLPPGFYTYRIDANDSKDYFGRLSLELQED